MRNSILSGTWQAEALLAEAMLSSFNFLYEKACKLKCTYQTMNQYLCGDGAAT